MSPNSFQLIAGNHYLDMLAEFVVLAMAEHGYEERMELNRPGSPQIWEFDNKGTIIAMSISPHEGNLSGKSEMKIEAESKELLEDIYEIVGTAVSMLVKTYSTQVFKSIKSKKGKMAIASAIMKQIEELKKGI